MQSGDILQIFFLTHVPFERYACAVAKRNYLHTHTQEYYEIFFLMLFSLKGYSLNLENLLPQGGKYLM